MVSANLPPNKTLTLYAYFSMEFMLSEALADLFRGLGDVAGDHLKPLAILACPWSAWASLPTGYFRQAIDHKGDQKLSTRTTIQVNCRSSL